MLELELELDLYSALGRIRGALDLHPACIGGALQRSWRAEWGRQRAATTDRHSLSLSLPTVFKAVQGEAKAAARRLD